MRGFVECLRTYKKKKKGYIMSIRTIGELREALSKYPADAKVSVGFIDTDKTRIIEVVEDDDLGFVYIEIDDKEIGDE